jgi:FAD/FMN-containing dehydrogenase
LRSSLSQPTGLLSSRLRAQMSGRVITPDDPAYDQARMIFYGGFDRRPQVIVQAADTDDVARVIALARDTGLELAVRSGGHSPAGHSVIDGGIVLDLSAMRALELDTEARTAWAEPGLTAGEYTTAAATHNLATGFGDTGSVGIGGITLAGGVGYLVRRHGLTIDNLLAAEVVTADGQLLRADANDHPDLFWALRGGGGNFGVATRFQFRLHPLSQVVGGMLLLPASAEVVAEFIALAEAAPEELSTIANVMPAPPLPFISAEQHGQLVVLALMVYAGDVEGGQRAVAPFRALATPLADLIKPMAYPDIYPPEDPDYHPAAVGHTMFLDRIDRHAAETIVGSLQASDASLRVAQLRVLGGAMARVPAEATAFAHRGSAIMATVASFYDGPADKPVRQAWVDQFAADLRQKDDSAYVGFLTDADPPRIRQAYPGAIWDRLVQVKARYDPTNLFHHNHNIPTAIEEPAQ